MSHNAKRWAIPSATASRRWSDGRLPARTPHRRDSGQCSARRQKAARRRHGSRARPRRVWATPRCASSPPVDGWSSPSTVCRNARPIAANGSPVRRRTSPSPRTVRPTKAAEGFAKKAGVTVDQLETESTDKGDYLAATVVHAGRATTEILSEAVPAVLASMRFPKMMRWGLGENFFVRPVHGLVAILDDAVVPMEAFGVASSRETVGHRVHGADRLRSGFFRSRAIAGALAERGVLIDPEERRRLLDEQAVCARRRGGLSGPSRRRAGGGTRRTGRVSRPSARLHRRGVPRVAARGGDHHPALSPEVPHPRERGRLAGAVVSHRRSIVATIRKASSVKATSGSSARGSPTHGSFSTKIASASSEDLAGDLERLEFHRVLGSMAGQGRPGGRVGSHPGRPTRARPRRRTRPPRRSPRQDRSPDQHGRRVPGTPGRHGWSLSATRRRR